MQMWDPTGTNLTSLVLYVKILIRSQNINGSSPSACDRPSELHLLFYLPIYTDPITHVLTSIQIVYMYIISSSGLDKQNYLIFLFFSFHIYILNWVLRLVKLQLVENDLLIISKTAYLHMNHILIGQKSLATSSRF